MSYGPILPSSIVIRHRTRGCPWYESLPDIYPVPVPTTNPAGMLIGTEEFSEDALALMAGSPSPSNLAQLQALDRQFASDYLSWRTPQFDTIYDGIAAVAPQGIADTIEWDYGGAASKTRVFTYPHNFSYQQLGHQIPGLDGVCPDGGTGQISTKTPCLTAYGPPVPAGNTNSRFSINKWNICLYDGRLRQVYEGIDNFDCGCAPCTKICVVECGNIPVYGALIQLFNGSTLIDQCVTGPSGCCTFCETGTYTIHVTVSGEIVYNLKRNLTGSTIVIALSVRGFAVCCGGYAIPETLTLTDAAGSLSFVYYPNSFYSTWYGGHAVGRLSCSVTTPNNICVAAPASQGPMRVCYQMICYAGQNPTFAIERSWSWVYQPGTLTPIWYQDPTGFFPGQPCTTGPPAMCGSPHTNASTDSKNPSSSIPFVISFNPVPAISNFTPDPIGGGLLVSS